MKPGGRLAFVTHDYQSLVNRLLGKRSPIIDVEHLQLFCPASMAFMLDRCGLRLCAIEGLANRYPVDYWLRLSPLDGQLKCIVSDLLKRTGLSRFVVSLDVGNFITVAEKV